MTKKIVAAILCILMVLSCSPTFLADSVVTVTYNANGGKLNGGTETATVDYTPDDGGYITLKNNPPLLRDGYIFKGWYKDEKCTKPASVEQKGDVTLYAGWYKINKVDIAPDDTSTTVTQADGAELTGVQMRMDDAGLRFVSRISRKLRRDMWMVSEKNVKYGSMLAIGDEIPENSMLTDELVSNSGTTFKKYYSEKNYYITNDYTLYTDVVINIPLEKFGLVIACRPFVEYVDANGFTQTYYYTEDINSSHYLAGAYAISLYDLANYIIDKTDMEEDNKEILQKGIIDAYDDYVARNDTNDDDGDGLTNGEEYTLGTDKNNPDTDGDGIPDGLEVEMGYDPLKKDSDDNGTLDGDEDYDGDGLTNKYELDNSLDPKSPDTDCDGLNDGEEVNKYHTDPLKADTDGDGFSDYNEILAGTDPLDPNDPGDGKNLQIPIDLPQSPTQEPTEAPSQEPTTEEPTQPSGEKIGFEEPIVEVPARNEIPNVVISRPKTDVPGTKDAITVSGSNSNTTVKTKLYVPDGYGVFELDEKTNMLTQLTGLVKDSDGYVTLPGNGTYMVIKLSEYKELLDKALKTSQIGKNIADLDYCVKMFSSSKSFYEGSWNEDGNGLTSKTNYFNKAIEGVSQLIDTVDHSALYIGRSGTYTGVDLSEFSETYITSSPGNGSQVAKTFLANGKQETDEFNSKLSTFNAGYSVTCNYYEEAQNDSGDYTKGAYYSTQTYTASPFSVYSTELTHCEATYLNLVHQTHPRDAWYYKLSSGATTQKYDCDNSVYLYGGGTELDKQVAIFVGNLKDDKPGNFTPGRPWPKKCGCSPYTPPPSGTLQPVFSAPISQGYYFGIASDSTVDGIKIEKKKYKQLKACAIITVGNGATADDVESTIRNLILEGMDDVDTTTDSNNDGISDFYTQKIVDGKLFCADGTNPFGNATYEEIQANDDFDGDGLKNGEEITVTEISADFSTQTFASARSNTNIVTTGSEDEDKTCMINKSSSPTDGDTDRDGIPDKKDPLPNNPVSTGTVFQTDANAIRGSVKKGENPLKKYYHASNKFCTKGYSYSFSTDWFIKDEKENNRKAEFIDSKTYNSELCNFMMLLSALAYRNNNPCTCETAEEQKKCNHDKSCNEFINFICEDEGNEKKLDQTVVSNLEKIKENEEVTKEEIETIKQLGTIEQLFDKMGCEKTCYSLWTDPNYSNANHDTITEDPHRGQAYFAIKPVEYKDTAGKTKKKYIVFVAIRGTWGSTEEWVGNGSMGANERLDGFCDGAEKYSLYGNVKDWNDPEAHLGFDVYASRVYRALIDFLGKHNELNNSSDISFLVTGHSRGAAVANLVGKKLLNKDSVMPKEVSLNGSNIEELKTVKNSYSNKSVYTYTFAAPNNTTASNVDDTEYDSIFNVMNDRDPVPYVAPAEWGFAKYGRNVSFTVTESWLSKIGSFFLNWLPIGFNGMSVDRIKGLMKTAAGMADDRNKLYTFMDDNVFGDSHNTYSADKFLYTVRDTGKIFNYRVEGQLVISNDAKIKRAKQVMSEMPSILKGLAEIHCGGTEEYPNDDDLGTIYFHLTPAYQLTDLLTWVYNTNNKGDHVSKWTKKTNIAFTALREIFFLNMHGGATAFGQHEPSLYLEEAFLRNSHANTPRLTSPIKYSISKSGIITGVSIPSGNESYYNGVLSIPTYVNGTKVTGINCDLAADSTIRKKTSAIIIPSGVVAENISDTAFDNFKGVPDIEFSLDSKYANSSEYFISYTYQYEPEFFCKTTLYDKNGNALKVFPHNANLLIPGLAKYEYDEDGILTNIDIPAGESFVNGEISIPSKIGETSIISISGSLGNNIYAKKISAITIPNTIKSIGKGAFDYLAKDSLTIKFEANSSFINYDSDKLEFHKNKDDNNNSYYILKNASGDVKYTFPKATNVSIPDLTAVTVND